MKQSDFISKSYKKWWLLLLVASTGVSAYWFSAHKFIERSIQTGLMPQKIKYATNYLSELLNHNVIHPLLPEEFWHIEDASERERLPLIRIQPASEPVAFSKPFEASKASMVEWHRSHGNNASTKYSNLNLINKDNVSQLRQAWVYDTPEAVANIQATPIYTGKLLVFPNALDEIVAVDPATGKSVWKFKPGITRPAQRGLAYWPGTPEIKPRILFSAGGRVFALDAATGIPSTEFNGGSVVLGYEIRVAPAISGNIMLTTSFKPALHAYDVKTGVKLWTTDFLLNDEMSDARNASPVYEGAHTWGGFSVDDTRHLAFMTTNNATPVGVGIHRRGRNAMANSVLAIDIKTGKHVWNHQEIAHDLWDLDLPAPPVLASINKDGRKLDVVVAVTKAGNTLILDRESGKPLFEQRLRRAPTSKIPGERTSAYQPDFQWPEPFAKQAFTIDDVTNISDESRQSVLQQLENANFGFYAPHELGKNTVFFGLHGGAMQMGPGLDQKTGILYIASTHEPSMFTIKSVRPSNEKRVDQKITGYQEFITHCASCHDSSQNAGTSAPSLEAVSNRFNDVQLKQIIRRGYHSMPAVTNISNIEVDRLVSYLLAVRQTIPEIPESISQASAEGLPTYTRTAYQKLRDKEGYPGSRPPWGTLNALDLNSGRIVWRVPLGRYQALIDKGLPVTGTENMGGPMVTAGGLVFVSGTKDLLIRAFDAENGKVLWEHALPFIGSASPMTYEHKGQQFIVIPATGGGTLALYDSRVATGGSFVAFRLGDTPTEATH